MLYIGVDLGTSSVKLLLMDESGRIENIVIREYPIYYPKPGWSEQNPEDWYNALTDGLKELIKNCNKDEIDGISFSGQMHGMVIPMNMTGLSDRQYYGMTGVRRLNATT